MRTLVFAIALLWASQALCQTFPQRCFTTPGGNTYCPSLTWQLVEQAVPQQQPTTSFQFSGHGQFTQGGPQGFAPPAGWTGETVRFADGSIGYVIGQAMNGGPSLPSPEPRDVISRVAPQVVQNLIQNRPFDRTPYALPGFGPLGILGRAINRARGGDGVPLPQRVASGLAQSPIGRSFPGGGFPGFPIGSSGVQSSGMQ